MLIEGFAANYLLGVAAMDTTHREFVDQVNQLESASGETFIEGFSALVAHTKVHFDYEQALMQESAFPAFDEHTGEHRRILGEMERFGRQVARGRVQMARAYVRETLPSWFQLHAVTMDSALAAHLKNSGKVPGSLIVKIG